MESEVSRSEWNHRTVRLIIGIVIAVACGTPFVLQPHWYTILIGFTFGPLIGFLAYDPRQTWQTIPAAWRATGQAARRFRKYWFNISQYLFLTFLVSLEIGFMVAACIIFLIYFVGHETNPDNFLYGPLIFGGAIALLCTLFLTSVLSKKDAIKRNDEFVQFLKIAAVKCNPFRLFFVAIRFLLWNAWRILYLPLGLIIVSIIGVAAPFYFLGWLCKQILSRERITCATFGAVGLWVTYLNGHTIPGMFLGMGVGAFTGVLSFEILSKRVLKVVPAKARS